MLSPRSMVPDTASQTAEPRPASRRWQGRGSLARRILAVNIVALILTGASLFYLDGFRTRLIQERRLQKEGELRIVASSLAAAPPASRRGMIDAVARVSGDRLRVYDSRGVLVLDSWATGPRSFRFVDPAREDWQRHAARWLDAIVDRLVVARIPLPFVDQGRAPASTWPELVDVMKGGEIASRIRLAPDRTIVTSAAVAIGEKRDFFVLSVQNPKDVTRLIREERLRLAIIVFVALAISIALSIYLARTIVRPLRHLAIAARRVRSGRGRDVVVPRLPERTDEIGLLARAVSDMTQALRERIDAIECFAADVAHELKNPLASLSSAIETLDRVEDPALKKQLTDIAAQDVRRLDRLISDIADMSRLDAQLTRTQFAPVDLGQLLGQALGDRMVRVPGPPHIKLAAPADGSAVVMGDAARLARLFDNLVDNAISFSPADGTVRVRLSTQGDRVVIAVEDEGPGVASSARDVIFDRFHSDRPEPYAFGKHSGLGLAIAKTIVEGHNGTIVVEDRESGQSGARFVVRLPAAGTGSDTA
jgi:two-component system, OmpR family, sensor histidine kinase ChvG